MDKDSERALRAEIAHLKERLEATYKVIVYGYPGQPAKTERCEHGRYGYEDCIECYDRALLAAIGCDTTGAEGIAR